MALLTMNFYAESLWMGTAVSVILPAKRDNSVPCQVLYLLHGGGGDHSYYHRHYPIEQMVQGYNLAVVMPSTPSRYKLIDMEHGEKWLSYCADELPCILGNMFNFYQDPANTFAMGISGGGYNALKLALHRPRRFGTAVGICPALLSKQFINEMDAHEDALSRKRCAELKHIFGFPIPPEDDAFLMLDAAAKEDVKAKMFVCCGTEDKLLAVNHAFYTKAAGLGFDVTWDQRPGGHDYMYGHTMIAEGLTWLPLQKL